MTNWRFAPEAPNKVVYPSCMALIEDDLKKLGKQIDKVTAQRDALLAQRKQMALEGREQGATWRSMATALGMTEHGLIKTTLDKKPKS
jgi:hypothetical protein